MKGLKDTCLLDLVITGSGEKEFISNLDECLSHTYVIRMMFYGKSYRSSQEWLGKFKNRNYNIFSIILYASKDVCYERAKYDKNPERAQINRTEEACDRYYREFYELEQMSVS